MLQRERTQRRLPVCQPILQSWHPRVRAPRLMQEKRRDQIDHIVIETTGLANPAPIIQTFFAEPTVSRFARLDGVVTVVGHLGVLLRECV